MRKEKENARIQIEMFMRITKEEKLLRIRINTNIKKIITQTIISIKVTILYIIHHIDSYIKI